ncbi:hypothetical protein [Leptospira kirschneri]|uniref:hypothetical protein n=1 Tax=Leptospira kirschneri TaxID=29507 RepID=UPI00046C7077|nr:hypothetical protein [Leptospira kirschneri]KON77398.1 Uncharacterized protein NV38_0001958 [Leptospira kirschneri serovar Mozdok]KPZ76975.1 hypothetical protein APS47_13125 [Leptospira kirschneri serovar Mozdok]NDK04690.1 hypothetical protein [Leptospira kirschneri serovar Mozdok]
MKNYIMRGGEQELPPPYRMKQVEFYAFCIQGNQNAIQSIVDRELNAPASGRAHYHVFSDYLFLVFAKQQYLAPGNDCGWVEETDVGFWIPLFEKEIHGIRFYQPYLFVDIPTAMATGREIYGFHKIQGQFQIPSLRVPPEYFSVDAITPRGKDRQAISQRMFTLSCTPGESRTKKLYNEFSKLGNHLVEILFDDPSKIKIPDANITINLWDNLFHSEIIMVFLKQFRDAADPTLACYQAIVEASSNVTCFRKGGDLEGNYILDVLSNPYFPFVSDFGLKSTSIPIQFGIWCDFDFDFSPGRIIHQNV